MFKKKKYNLIVLLYKTKKKKHYTIFPFFKIFFVTKSRNILYFAPIILTIAVCHLARRRVKVGASAFAVV